MLGPMKILIIRFSSIGDIVLTSPVVRCLKQQRPDAEIHFLTKEVYRPLLSANPYISRIILLNKKLSDLKNELRAERYDHIIDLHKNLRTRSLQWMLFRSFHTFPKLNVRKWLRVRLKLDVLPRVHIVDRYLKAVAFLGIQNDGKGLDHFIPEGAVSEEVIAKYGGLGGFTVVVIGAKQFTKRIPAEKVVELIGKTTRTIILVGGPEDRRRAEEIIGPSSTDRVLNACGELSLNESAWLIQRADAVVTGDTGMMHIAAALKKEVISLWGNTLPEFGMFPYLPEGMEKSSHILQREGLKCRPCTKLGYKACPRKHFKCMMEIPVDDIMRALPEP